MNKKSIKNILTNAALLSSAIAIFLILLELFLYIKGENVCYPYPLGLYAADESTCYKFVPNFNGRMTQVEYENSIATNSEGYRDYEYDYYAKKSAVYRVAIIGDSFVFGAGVEMNETFAKIIESNLRKINKSIEVLNLGVNGWGPVEYDALAGKILAKYNPDLVIETVFTGNDFVSKNSFNCTKSVVDGILYEGKNQDISKKPLFKRAVTSLNIESRSYCFFKRNLLLLPSLRKKYLNKEHTSLEYFRKNSGKETADSFMLTTGLVNKTGNYAIKSGADFVLVIIPSKEEAYPEKYFRNLNPKDYDFGMPANFLAYSFKKGFDVVDLRECFKNYSGLYYETDGHLTPLGHEIAASCLYREISSRARFKNNPRI